MEQFYDFRITVIENLQKMKSPVTGLV